MLNRSTTRKNKGEGYYTIRYAPMRIKYDVHFPVEWAMDDNFIEPRKKRKSNTNQYVGSLNCANCRKYGSINGVFVQYCTNCVSMSGRPGCGCRLQDLIPDTTLHDMKDFKLYGYECDHKKCIFKTYLNGVNLLTIGSNNTKVKKM